MKKLSAIILDDEPSARNVLLNKLQPYQDRIDIIGNLGDPHEAIALIERLEPDILFLDIQMPELSGFDVLRRIPDFSGEVIFVTAYDEYALEAFKFCASGYLLKPLINSELAVVMERLLEKNIPDEQPSSGSRLLNYLEAEKEGIKKIYISSVKGFDFIDVKEIQYLEAADKYTFLFLENARKVVSSKNISYFVELLSTFKFFQCHRSFMINLDFIARYSNEGFVILSNGKEIPLSRRRKKAFFDILGL